MEVDYSSIAQKTLVVVQLLVLHVFVLIKIWHYPGSRSVREHVFSRVSLAVFYIAYATYCALSCLQCRYDTKVLSPT